MGEKLGSFADQGVAVADIRKNEPGNIVGAAKLDEEVSGCHGRNPLPIREQTFRAVE
jgi:hypothetical protein